ncbi:Crp/Fnr family transcriptional regulator [Flagellimonas sp.]|uniref:Crp/Fnr family transcriptional regulator n=1 Tax=Flagellimonas sp. TaxID=2058762 RepID=UPI003BA96D4B
MKQKEALNHSLKSILDQITFIDEIAWNDFIQHQIEKSLKRGEIIWNEGQVCRHLVFLKKGLIRSFSLNNGKEVTFNFYDTSSLFYDDYSFISQKSSKKTYQVLENSEVILIPREHLFKMFDKYKCFERIGRVSVENAHIRMIEERERLSQNNAEENYKQLLANKPYLIQILPQKVIASYLNISTEHLSRIRSKLS